MCYLEAGNQMGRKKVFPSSGVMNPLQRMLGTQLRLERTRLGYSSSDVASRLGLTDTYLRLAESGRATLNQSLAFKIIEVFADSSAQTHDSRTISFNRFALYMVGMHWLGAEMAEYAPEDAARRAADELAARVGDFQVFFDRVRPYFDFGEGTNEQRNFLEDVAAPEVGSFLRSEVYGSADVAEVAESVLPKRELLDLPTLNIDILLDLKQALTGRSFVHTADVASKWESQRASQFRTVHGLYKDAEALVVSEHNLSQFHFEYLSEKRFAALQMIFMKAQHSESALKEKFVSYINKGRENVQGLSALRPEEIQKIHFMCLSEAESKKHQKLLSTLRIRQEPVGTGKNEPHDAYWSFETHSGLKISFVGVLGRNADNTRNLSLEDSFDKEKIFRQLWSEIIDSRSS